MRGPGRAKVRVVTAYVPIEDHTRSAAEYGKLGEQLIGALGDFKPIVYMHDIRGLWMTPFLERIAGQGHQIRHATGDNPQKNSMEYHAVQHNKFAWLERAAAEDQDADTFIWLDFGCMRLPGFDSNTLTDFLGRVKKNDLAAPGCWGKQQINDHYPCWRFCGTMFIVPRQDVEPLAEAFKSMTRMRVLSTRFVSWEVNDLAYLELANVPPPMRWYAADHNALMLTRYQ